METFITTVTDTNGTLTGNRAQEWISCAMDSDSSVDVENINSERPLSSHRLNESWNEGNGMSLNWNVEKGRAQAKLHQGQTNGSNPGWTITRPMTYITGGANHQDTEIHLGMVRRRIGLSTNASHKSEAQFRKWIAETVIQDIEREVYHG